MMDDAEHARLCRDLMGAADNKRVNPKMWSSRHRETFADVSVNVPLTHWNHPHPTWEKSKKKMVNIFFKKKIFL